MALLFVDGFDHYATADITKKWALASGGGSINSSGGRRSGGAYTGSTTFMLTKGVTAGSSFVMGVALNLSGGLANTLVVFGLVDAGTTQCDLRVNTDLTLSVTRNGTALTSGTSSNTLTTGTGIYNYVEWKVTIADSISAASCVVKVNGVTWITVATGQDTKATANTTASSFTLGSTSNIFNAAFFDDLYLCDQSGSTNNDFLGDCRIDTLLPNGDGNYTSFTPSTGTTHYLLVDESTPNTTDYNESSTATNKDSYQMVNLGALASQTIYGVQVLGAVLKDDAGARSIKVGVRSSSTDSVSAAQAVTTSQFYYNNIHETNPATAVAWTESGVNAAEALFEVA